MARCVRRRGSARRGCGEKGEGGQAGARPRAALSPSPWQRAPLTWARLPPPLALGPPRKRRSAQARSRPPSRRGPAQTSRGPAPPRSPPPSLAAAARAVSESFIGKVQSAPRGAPRPRPDPARTPPEPRAAPLPGRDARPPQSIVAAWKSSTRSLYSGSMRSDGFSPSSVVASRLAPSDRRYLRQRQRSARAGRRSEPGPAPAAAHLAMSAWPSLQAMCRGVQPFSSLWWMSAPYFTRSLTQSRFPVSTAWCRAAIPAGEGRVGPRPPAEHSPGRSGAINPQRWGDECGKGHEGRGAESGCRRSLFLQHTLPYWGAAARLPCVSPVIPCGGGSAEPLPTAWPPAPAGTSPALPNVRKFLPERGVRQPTYVG